MMVSVLVVTEPAPCLAGLGSIAVFDRSPCQSEEAGWTHGREIDLEPALAPQGLNAHLGPIN